MWQPLLSGPRSGSRIFSRWDADFQRKFENFVDLYFRSTKLIFWSLPDHYKDPILTNLFLKRRQILKKKRQKCFFFQALFGKLALTPSQRYYILVKDAFRKILESVSQKKGFPKILQRRTVWVGRGPNP